jgi:serine/threonine-protein kinase HipA
MTEAFGALDVFIEEARVGQLTADEQGRMTFAYVTADAPSISLSLAPRPEPYPDENCRAFFAGLLPEGAALDRAAAQKRLQSYETFNLLYAYGAECAGAVRLLPPGVPPTVPAEYELLEGADLAAAIADTAVTPLFARDPRARLSLAGVQSKTAVRVVDGRIFKPLRGSPSTHILKISSPDFPDLVENEFFCMTLAARLGINAATTELREAGGRKFLLIGRYDRVDGGDRVRELHQEDICQALGYPPARKYELDDAGQKAGPGLDECFTLLDRTRTPGLDRRRLLHAVVFNYLIANADAHGKNYSLLYEPGARSPRLAPLYDLVCTRIYRALATDLAMRHGTSSDPDAVTKEDWEIVAKHAGVRVRLPRTIAADLCSRILPAAQTLQQEVGYLPAENILRVIAGRVVNLAEAFDLSVAVDVPPYIDTAPGWPSLS